MAEHEHDHCGDEDCCSCGCDCENEDEIITLTDEEGNATDFVVVEGTEHEGTLYLALVEADKADDEECEFTILKVIEDADQEVFVSIEDENEFNTVLGLLQAKIENAGLFDFEEVESTDEE